MKNLTTATPKGFLKPKAVAVEDSSSRQHVLEYLDRADSVAVLLKEPSGRFVMVEQFRVGPATKKNEDSFTLEPVAGMIDQGETPEQAAIRECKEEIGTPPTWLKSVGYIWMCPGVSNEAMHLFIGECGVPAEVGGTDAGEEIKVRLLTESQMLALEALNKLNTPHARILSTAWQLHVLQNKNEPGGVMP